MFRRREMPELSLDVIHELRKSLPLLERLKRIFSSENELSGDEFMQLRRALERVQSLTGYEEFLHWVGSIPSLPEAGWDESLVYTVERNHAASAERLYIYVQGILQTQELEETLNRLTQENASLKYQLRETQISATYSVPPREDLLNSLERELATHTKNLYMARETKAKYGLNPPLDILNEIEHAEKEIERINAQIAYFGSQQTQRIDS
jgi:hypothetical protein